MVPPPFCCRQPLGAPLCSAADVQHRVHPQFRNHFPLVVEVGQDHKGAFLSFFLVNPRITFHSLPACTWLSHRVHSVDIIVTGLQTGWDISGMIKSFDFSVAQGLCCGCAGGQLLWLASCCWMGGCMALQLSISNHE